MAEKKKRAYSVNTRLRQAQDTRFRITAAAAELLVSVGYDAMTIDSIAERAEVSSQTVYAAFRSKAGILAELLDKSAFDSRRVLLAISTKPRSRRSTWYRVREFWLLNWLT